MSLRTFVLSGLIAILFPGCGSPPKPTVRAKPELRRFSSLKPEDFTLHPVWVQCHVIDHGEPWYDQTDEETFRPWTGALPVDPEHAIFLVRARFTLVDGTSLSGFVTPSGTLDLGRIQPSVFGINGQQVAFWLGMFPHAQEGEKAFLALGRTPSEVFPVGFSADSRLARCITSATLEGFYSVSEGNVKVDK